MEQEIDKEPDIKNFINHLHTHLNNIKEEMHENATTYKQLDTELQHFEKLTESIYTDLANAILDNIEFIETDFKKIMAEEKSACSFIKQELASLNQDKMKIEQNCLLLGTRTEEVEKTVGISLKLPPIRLTLKTNSNHK